MFGFNFDARAIIIDNVRVRSAGQKQTIHAEKIAEAQGDEKPAPIENTSIYFDINGIA